MLFFGLNTWVLAAVLGVIMGGAPFAGVLLGQRIGRSSDTLREPLGVVQGALIGFMGLILAFGLSLALGRYETRRVDTVDEANAISRTYLRAQTLPEPMRGRTLELLPGYTRTSIAIADTVPGTDGQELALAASEEDQRRLWRLAGDALDQEPDASAPRLYVESLNEMFDAQSTRVYGLDNRVPTAVLVLEIVGAAIALGLLALHLAALGRGLTTVLVAAVLVTLTLVVTPDLHRPVRGLIQVNATPLTDVRASMAAPPASAGP